MKLHMPVPPGELIDRITILKVKLFFITDKKKRKNIESYLSELMEIRNMLKKQSARLRELERKLEEVNKKQWEIEDAIRTHLKKHGADKTFGALVKSLHKSNDRRVAIKRMIDKYLESEILEEKQYA
jgi:ATPase subunit of ABC transporter with duplicated ATPase domains